VAASQVETSPYKTGIMAVQPKNQRVPVVRIRPRGDCCWLAVGYQGLGRQIFQNESIVRTSLEPGRIQFNGPAKAAREVRTGDMLRVTNERGDFHVEVLLLSEIREPASVAQTLYRETEASCELRQKTGSGA
jgi:ribosomal 50S subunit-recycling heat shock protein